MRTEPWVWGVLLAALPGCYLFHTREGAGGSMDAGHAAPDAASSHGADASVASPRDASTLPSLDAFEPDAGPPLPAEPAPDPGPDGRPSDDPDGWMDPPDVAREEPCCILGEPVALASRPLASFTSEPPLLARRPGRWALAVTRETTADDVLEHRVTVYELEDDGTPVGPPHELAGPPIFGAERTPVARALRWGGGRWALGASGDSTSGLSREMHVRLFDRAFTPATPWLALGEGMAVDAAYLAHGDGWLAFTSFDGGLRTTPFDERLGARPSLEAAAQGSSLLRAASFASRAAVVPISAESLPELVVADASGLELGRIPREGRWVTAGGLAALRDLAVVAVRNEGRVEVEVLDPFALRRVSGPRAIAEPGLGDDAAIARSVDVAASSKFGLAGVCWGTGNGAGRDATGSLLFALVGPDGATRGAPVTVVASAFRGGLTGCAVATDERGFLVGWYDGTTLWVRRVDLAAGS